jgi:hypothetical protein
MTNQEKNRLGDPTKVALGLSFMLAWWAKSVAKRTTPCDFGLNSSALGHLKAAGRAQVWSHCHHPLLACALPVAFCLIATFTLQWERRSVVT